MANFSESTQLRYLFATITISTSNIVIDDKRPAYGLVIEGHPKLLSSPEFIAVIENAGEHSNVTVASGEGSTAELIHHLSNTPVQMLPDKCETHAATSTATPNATVDDPTLSWNWIVKFPFKFTIDTVNDDHYHLYKKALKCSLEIQNSIYLSESTRSIDNLVNHLADRYSIPSTNPPTALVTLRLDSVLDFILFGMLLVLALEKRFERADMEFNAISHRDESQHFEQDENSNQVKLINILLLRWLGTCKMRHQTKWSPMPWSQVSKEEENSVGSFQVMHYPPRTNLNDMDDDSLAVNLRFAKLAYGHPIDIPWFDFSHRTPQHDYPLCSTLSSYIRVRRAVYPTVLDDASLWLAAMTFGLLEAVTGMKIPNEQLLSTAHEGDGNVRISGAHLLRLIVRWSESVKAARASDEDEDRHVRYGLGVSGLLNHAFRALGEEQENRGGGRGMLYWADLNGDQLNDIRSSLRLLVSILCGHAEALWPHEHGFKVLKATYCRITYERGVHVIWHKRMRRAGWCPSLVSQLFMASIPHSLVSNLTQLHPFISDTADEHKACTQTSCKAYSANRENDRDAHVVPDCECTHIRSPLWELSNADDSSLADGCRITLTFDECNGTLKAGSSASYVAFSYGLLDGLGTTCERGLLTCQISHLAALARQLVPGTGAFWIDSLCTPTAEQRIIPNMEQRLVDTYAEASYFVVLDPSICTHCSIANLSPQENLLRIAVSPWIRSMRTLPESLLAKELFFEFSDGLVRYEQLLEDVKIQFQPFQSLDPTMIILPYTFDFGRDSPSPTRERQCTLDQIMKLIRVRINVRPEDETIVIASLRIPGTDVKALLDIKGEETAERRMKAFLIQVRNVPSYIPLYVFLTPRITSKPFRWCPTSLTGMAYDPPSNLGTAICTERGLFGEYGIIKLDEAGDIGIIPLTGPRRWTDLIIEVSGKGTYRASIQVDSSMYNTPGLLHSFDMLLFPLGWGFERGNTIPCAAVHTQNVNGEASDDLDGSIDGRVDFRCEYVSTGELKHCNRNRSWVQVKGEIGKARIQLL